VEPHGLDADQRFLLVVFAVREGLLSLEAACVRYNLTIEEFTSWRSLIDGHGMRGLRTTRLRIPMKAATDSDGKRPPVPIQNGQFGRGSNMAS